MSFYFKLLINIAILTSFIISKYSLIFGQDYSPLLGTDTRDLLHETLSGELAKEHVIQITRHLKRHPLRLKK